MFFNISFENSEETASCQRLLISQVLVFNCDEGIDFQAMGRIFVGLVRCGAWGCFDEFNRLQGCFADAGDGMVGGSLVDQTLVGSISAVSTPFVVYT